MSSYVKLCQVMSSVKLCQVGICQRWFIWTDPWSMSTGVASGRQALDGCSYGTGGTGLGMSVMWCQVEGFQLEMAAEVAPRFTWMGREIFGVGSAGHSLSPTSGEGGPCRSTTLMRLRWIWIALLWSLATTRTFTLHGKAGRCGGFPMILPSTSVFFPAGFRTMMDTPPVQAYTPFLPMGASWTCGTPALSSARDLGFQLFLCLSQ